MPPISTNKYTLSFETENQITKYHNKFNSRLDRLRHTMEQNTLSKNVRGDLFDCSIGDGRFIKKLSQKTKSYSGMDYSASFVDFIKKHYPDVNIVKANLEEPLLFPENTFDTVICLRTLFALNKVDKIIAEMTRLTKNGGRLIFDYPPKPYFNSDFEKTFGSYNIPQILNDLNLKILKQYPLDGIFHLIKKNRRLARLFNSRFNILPDFAYLAIMKISLIFISKRILYVVEK